MNNILLQGRIPFAPNFIPANGEKKACAFFTLAVQTKQKDEETGYYKELNIRCRAFGGWAESLNAKFEETGNRTVVDVEGELVQGNDYEKDGEIVKGQLELNVLRIHDYNTLDKTVVRGRIPNFDNAIKFVEATDDKKACIFFTVAISTGIKDEETGYYKERLVKCKAFNGTAEFINKYYQTGDLITLDGKYVDGQDYTNADGELVKAMPELLISNVYGFPRRKEEGASTTKKAAPAAKAPGKVPAAPGAKTPGKLGAAGGPKKLGGLKKLTK